MYYWKYQSYQWTRLDGNCRFKFSQVNRHFVDFSLTVYMYDPQNLPIKLCRAVNRCTGISCFLHSSIEEHIGGADWRLEARPEFGDVLGQTMLPSDSPEGSGSEGALTPV